MCLTKVEKNAPETGVMLKVVRRAYNPKIGDFYLPFWPHFIIKGHGLGGTLHKNKRDRREMWTPKTTYMLNKPTYIRHKKTTRCTNDLVSYKAGIHGWAQHAVREAILELSRLGNPDYYALIICKYERLVANDSTVVVALKVTPLMEVTEYRYDIDHVKQLMAQVKNYEYRIKRRAK